MKLDFRHTQNLHAVSHPRWAVEKCVLIDQLAEIFVRRYHMSLKPLLLRLPRECPDNVIGFIAVACQHRDSKRLQHPMHMGQGQAQILRHHLARRLVFGIGGVTGCRGVCIEGHGNVRRLPVFHDVQQRLRKSIERRRVDPSRREDRPRNQRKMRAIDQRHSVEQE